MLLVPLFPATVGGVLVVVAVVVFVVASGVGYFLTETAVLPRYTAQGPY